MNRMIKYGKQVWKKAVLIIALLAFGPGSGLAGDVMEILPINPVTKIQVRTPSLAIIHGRGILQRIAEDENAMVIGDIILPLLTETKYFLFDGTPTYRSAFKVGMLVAYRLNDKRQIIELWDLVN